MNFRPQARPRHLVLVLGEQLNLDSAAFDGFDPACDAVWMAEVAEESTHVWSHKARIAMFLSAMRQFRDTLRGQGITVHYRQLGVDFEVRLDRYFLCSREEFSAWRCS